VGLVGAEVVRAGKFDLADDRADVVVVGGARVRQLDLAQIYARVQTGGIPVRSGA
jgi:Asp/Glu/hydantoin racemase